MRVHDMRGDSMSNFNPFNFIPFKRNSAPVFWFAALLPVCGAVFTPASARTLSVGPGLTYAMPSDAAAKAQDNDTVVIAPGIYAGEVSTWKANGLVLRGSTAFARLQAPALIANGKAIWVIQGKNTVVENIEFSGAKVPDMNGAGIRQEGDDLTVRHCRFIGNEDGIL